MKINQENDGESMLYCLSSRRHFKTIVELVSYYERNDLGENFAGYAPKLILNRQYLLMLHLLQSQSVAAVALPRGICYSAI